MLQTNVTLEGKTVLVTGAAGHTFPSTKHCWPMRAPSSIAHASSWQQQYGDEYVERNLQIDGSLYQPFDHPIPSRI